METRQRISLKLYFGSGLDRRQGFEMAKFAQNTDVPVAKSREEIEKLITRYGATATAFMTGADSCVVAFEAVGRRVMFTLPMPSKTQKDIANYRHSSGSWLARSKEAAEKVWEQACRQRWRALALVIKAKLEAVESGITTFEDEFMAHIVMPDGQTVSTHIRPRIAEAYAGGKMLPLLPPPTRPN
jgi:hypothetical protein